MSPRIASGCFEPRLPTPDDTSSFERATRDFYELIVTLDPADLLAADYERLRELRRDLLLLARKRSLS